MNKKKSGEKGKKKKNTQSHERMSNANNITSHVD